MKVELLRPIIDFKRSVISLMIVVMRAMNYPQLAQHTRKDATLKETSVAGPKTLATSLTGRDKVVERRHG